MMFFSLDSKNSGALCTTCKLVVGYADTLLKAKTTEVLSLHTCLYTELFVVWRQEFSVDLIDF